MTCLRYPNSDPYYPGRVIHLEPSDDAWEMARAWSRRVEVIECDCVATQGVSCGSEGAEMGRMWENGSASNEAAPAGNRGLTSDCEGVDMAGDILPANRPDGCPHCCIRGNLPTSTRPVPNGVECAYVCRACGTEWTTSYWGEVD